MITCRISMAALLSCASLALLSGCATQSSATGAVDTNAADKSESRTFITGSRLPIKNTTEMIGVKTVEQSTIREERMFENSPGKSN